MERQGLRALESGADRDVVESALFEIKRVIAGQDEMLERVFVCLLAGGHLLIEGVPGLAKTLTIKTVADVLGGTLPAGPVHARPRARPTSSARASTAPASERVRHRARAGLLQLPPRRRDQPRAREGAVGAARGDAGAAGHDRQGDARRPVAVPRHRDAEPDRVRGHVPAARGAGRPLHAQGARRLPGAGGRADRDRAGARRAGRRRAAALGRASSQQLQAATRRVYVDPAVVALRARARDRDAASSPSAGSRSSPPYVEYGASPRGPINLVLGARALALLRGRRYALPQDVRELAKDVLRHRLVLSYEALAEGVDADADPRPRARGDPDAAARPRPAGGRMSTVHALRPARTPGAARPRARSRGAAAQADLTVRRRIDGLLAGDHRSWALGDGTELAQVRPYDAGDDVRLIDWNVTARTGEPHVRVNVAERAVETWLLLDTSASMTFGTADRRKWDVAEGVALAVGHFAVASRQPPRPGDVRRPRSRRLAGPPGESRPARAPDRAAARARPRAGRPDVARRRAGAGRTARPPPRRDRGRLRLPRPARLAAARCSTSRRATTSSRSRSATRASRSCRTSATSGSSTRSPAGSCGSTPAAASCASGSAPRRRRSVRSSPASCARSASAPRRSPPPATGSARSSASCRPRGGGDDASPGRSRSSGSPSWRWP